jgi:hypothetical protein
VPMCERNGMKQNHSYKYPSEQSRGVVPLKELYDTSLKRIHSIRAN